MIRLLKEETTFDDSHPSLRERTEALGIAADPDDPLAIDAILAFLGQVEKSAAEEYFGDRLRKILLQADAKWVREALPRWKESRDEYFKSESILRDYQERDETTLTLDECRKKATALISVYGPEQVGEQTSALLKRFPDDPRLLFLTGFCLTKCNDDSGITMLQRAAESDRRCAKDAYEAIAWFQHGQGDHQQAQLNSERADEFEEREQEETEKLCELAPNEVRLSMSLLPQDIESTKAILKELKKVSRAYAYRKESPGWGISIDVLVLVAPLPSFVKSRDDFLRNQIALAAGALRRSPFTFVTVVTDDSSLARDLAQNPSLQIYFLSSTPTPIPYTKPTRT